MDMPNTVNIKFCDGRICVISLVGIIYDMCGLAIIHNILLWPKISKGKKQFLARQMMRQKYVSIVATCTMDKAEG